MQISADYSWQSPDTRSGAYATKEDFCRIFSEGMNNLYLLSLLLTADHAKAEQCFVAGIEDCSEGRSVFKDWARSWSRRIIVQAAIRAIAPNANCSRDTTAATVTTVPANPENAALRAITELPAFERFAFVMSALERFSDKDCCVLLGCSRQELISARGRALEKTSTMNLATLIQSADSSCGVYGVGANTQ